MFTFEEMMCFSKVYNAVWNRENIYSITKHDKEIAAEVLKKLADQREDWTPEMKSIYKLMVDVVKNS